jgi:two-component system nitrogen regulation response regulator GlnG
MLKCGLEKCGIRVLEAENGLVGEDVLSKRSHEIQLVICDISMPEQDGITTLRNIKKKYPDLPVIMLTAYSDKSSVVQCAQIGIAGFMAKPFDIKRIRSRIYEILKLSPQAQEAEGTEEAEVSEEAKEPESAQ